ncbi:MAG: hypothetical protein GXP42_13480 [Chloroflexi bacterium]|nr:hypothetical protein [Chloroflexota bacterium]
MAALMALLLAGCQAQPNRTLPLDTNWGRGLWVGTGHLREPIALAVEPDGTRLYLVWAQKGEQGIGIHTAQIDQNAGIAAEAQLDAGLFLPRTFRLFLLPDGQMRLLTLARPNKDALPGVFYLRLSSSGELLARPERVTPEGWGVESYDAAFRSPDAIELVWEASADVGGGLRHQRLTGLEDGLSTSKPVVLVERGQGPSLVIEPSGALHLLWHDDREVGDRLILYAELDATEIGPVEGEVIVQHGRSEGVNFSSPALAYDDDHFYAFWHQEFFSGLAAGTATVSAVSFPKNDPAQTHRFDLAIPEMIPSADAWPENMDFIPIASDDVVAFRSPYALHPSAVRVPTPGDRLMLLMSAKLTYRLKSEMQPVMVILQDGDQVGYAPIARTRFLSYFPVGVGDRAGALYAAWSDFRGAGQYLIFLSSTSAAWQEGILQLKDEDVLQDMLSELGFGLLAAGGLIPMLVFILVLPLVLLALLALTGWDRSLRTRAGRIQLTAAIVIYYVIKTAAFAPALTSPTLTRSLDPLVASAMLLLLPLLIFLAAAAGMALYIHRSDNPGLITSFFIFAIIDLPLTAVIYAPAFY